MGRFTGKSCRLLTMLGMTATFFLVEIIVGYITNSLALVGDSYHMLSDVVALCVGFASVRISKWNTQKNTFGWARAEVLGALVNSVFLMALCFTIFVEAIQRMFHNEHIHDPDLMLIVGGIGLGVNLIGLGLFHGGHGHSHGGHGHSHGGHGHSHSKKRDHHTHSHGNGKSGKTKSSNTMLPNGEVSPSDDRLCTGLHDELSTSDEEEDGQTLQPKIKSSAQLNMRGVFLHVLGDALGSVIVIVSALIIKYVNSPWKYKADPIMSMVMVIIILCTSIPLLKESAMILMQTVPTHITVRELQEKLLQKVEGVLAVHEFHIWQLAGNRIIASAHIRCQNLRDYMRIAEDVKTFFHNEGIHSTTIQPEFLEEPPIHESPSGRDCVLECGPDKKCFPDTCCGSIKSKDGKRESTSDSQLRQRPTTCISGNDEANETVSLTDVVTERSTAAHLSPEV